MPDGRQKPILYVHKKERKKKEKKEKKKEKLNVTTRTYMDEAMIE